MRRYADSDIRSIREELSRYVISKPCSSCNGDRLNASARNVFIDNKNISDLTKLTIDQVFDFFESLELEGQRGEIASKILSEISQRLHFLINVGLDYLNLERKANSLSGGEAQRIRLASQIGAGLIGVLYVLDEPSIGLHQRDNQKLLDTLIYLRDLGNTVIVVEHDEDAIRQADYVVDIGPGAGIHGGEIVSEGTFQEIKDHSTLTADYLAGRRQIEVPKNRRKGNGKSIKITGATGNNLKNVTAEFPLGKMICVTGVSGSGKSTLINETLYPILNKHIYRGVKEPMPYKKITGLEHVDKVIDIDQSPIGRTTRSNPATYTGVFSEIRNLFAKTPEAAIRGYKPGRFSFNVKNGRCETCQGGGVRIIEMNFLPDVHVECDTCQGKRFNRETLEIRYKGKSIADVLEMTIDHAVEFFKLIPKIHSKLKTIKDVGLGYITLGQRSTTLSGGEAQRIKLASELSKRDTGNTFYILDEPTTGLHFEDIRVLMGVLNTLANKGNTVLIIEHNMDVIKLADYIIDIGMEGGKKGGEILCKGTPEQIVKDKKSYTAQFLKQELG